MAQAAQTAAIRTHGLRAEDLLELPDDDRQYELVAGELIIMPPPGIQQGRLQPRLAGRLLAHVEAADLGTVVTECGFILARDPDTVRAPDVAFIAAERLASGSVPELGYPTGAPELAVEIRSPTNTPSEIRRKVREYQAAGARLVWQVDPIDASVTVNRADGSVQTLRGDDVLSGEDVVPGFTLPLTDLFR